MSHEPDVEPDIAPEFEIELEPGRVEDLSHLHESARPVARLPAAERLARVRADRWIGYTRATQALDQLHTLLDWPAKQRMPNLLVIGPTNNGKSMIVEKFRRSHPPISHPDAEEIPVLVVQMPSDPHVARFYTGLLSALGAPLRPRQRLAELEQLAVRLLRQAAVRMLVIDELHNVLAGRDGARREFLNLLRFLGNELKIPLVGVGTRDAYLAIRSDDQLENRFPPFVLPRWEPGREASTLLASFAAAFPLRRPSYLATPEMTEYLLTRSEGTIGELAALLTEAAVAAIESGEEAITQRTLLLASYTGPTERRRKFERELA
ncbi:TniB family NTP-binding protein [Nonomuraea sp. 3N208]|uniref:TniB family NTP-binding protein n=1 Tax=Nonomuraea sp. 3N208 TaxID=3457421 RepID=UPI003FD546CF